VAYYVAGAPHVIKSAVPAGEDRIFQRVSGVVASETVLAHLRKATVGDINILNAHPFQFGAWVFAHNGEINRFHEVKDELRAQITPTLRRYILGDTDSETFFYLFLTFLSRQTELHRKGTQLTHIVEALGQAHALTRKIADRPDERSKLTMIVTDGNAMVGVCSNMPLRFSTYKHRCADRDQCPFLSRECEAPTERGKVNHLVIASEDLKGDNVWDDLTDDTYVAVDWGMSLYRGALPA
jgi:glutamine amidotransferase